MSNAVLTFRRDQCSRQAKFHFTMTPGEALGVAIAYLPDIPDALQISAITPVVTDLLTGAVVTGTLVSGTAIEADVDGNNTIARVDLHNGVDHHPYRLVVDVAMDDTFTVDQPCLEFRVRGYA